MLQIGSVFILGILVGFMITSSGSESPSVPTKKDSGTSEIGTEETPGHTNGDISPAARKFAAVYDLSEDDLIRGDVESNIVVVEYSDLQCPYCQSAHAIFSEIVGNGVAWVYRHLPLEQIHPQAHAGAVIAECVKVHADNDTAWEYLDAVFAKESVGSEDEFKSIAKQVSYLTDAQLSACLAPESEPTKAVNSHIADAEFLGINGTPGGFIINRKTGKTFTLRGMTPKENLEQIIQSLR